MRAVVRGVSLLILLAVLACMVLVAVLLGRCVGRTESEDIVLEPTPAVIMAVMPRSELYVATAMVEDFVSRQATERRLGIFSREHSCMLVMRQKVSYKMDLSQVEYEVTGLHSVRVRLPEIEYTASTVSTSFISDDEAYWKKSMPSTFEMKRKVEMQIRERFDTPESRGKAMRTAMETVSHMLSQLGYEAEFIPQTMGGGTKIEGR